MDSMKVLLGQKALARFGWESNHHLDVLKSKKENDQFERRSSPSAAPQASPQLVTREIGDSTKPECKREDAALRRERVLTGDSVLTSGVGSLSEDSATADGRRATTLDSMIVEWESRSRKSTIVYCINQGFVANRDQLIVQGTVADMVRDPHAANAARERWKLVPFRTKRFLEVNRSFGNPARYVYMTPEEDCSWDVFRRKVG
ncbi:hypothetical protein COOONC_19685 [Cooperia oncophora]